MLVLAPAPAVRPASAHAHARARSPPSRPPLAPRSKPVDARGKRKRPSAPQATKQKKKAGMKIGKKTIGAGLLRTKKKKKVVVASPGAEGGDYGFNF